MIDWLHAVSAWLEDWSDRHSHIIALLEAVSTTAAVIVALVASAAAKRATRPKLRVSVSLYRAVPGRGEGPSEWRSYIAVRLTNVGTVPARLQSTFFYWIVRFGRVAAPALPLDEGRVDPLVGPRPYPILLQPNHSELVFLHDRDTF